MRNRFLFVLVELLYLGLSVECRADQCDDLSDRVTRLNNEISQEAPKTAQDAMQNSLAMAGVFGPVPNGATKIYCSMYDLNVAKAKLYRTCYQQLGYTKLRAEEYARQFDSGASAIANQCQR